MIRELQQLRRRAAGRRGLGVAEREQQPRARLGERLRGDLVAGALRELRARAPRAVVAAFERRRDLRTPRRERVRLGLGAARAVQQGRPALAQVLRYALRRGRVRQARQAAARDRRADDAAVAGPRARRLAPADGAAPAQQRPRAAAPVCFHRVLPCCGDKCAAGAHIGLLASAVLLFRSAG